jgi:hypothetical protein
MLHSSHNKGGWFPTQKHGLQMKHNYKDGHSWWSHQTAEGQWCKGR